MQIEFREEKGYLRFTCTGAISYEGMANLVERTHAEAGTASRRILLDFRAIEGVFDNLARYRTGELAARLLKGHRILSLARPESINRLAENTAVNRGVEVFTTHDEEEGMTWLLR